MFHHYQCCLSESSQDLPNLMICETLCTRNAPLLKFASLIQYLLQILTFLRTFVPNKPCSFDLQTSKRRSQMLFRPVNFSVCRAHVSYSQRTDGLPVITLLHEIFAARNFRDILISRYFSGKIEFRDILISRFRQKVYFPGI